MRSGLRQGGRQATGGRRKDLGGGLGSQSGRGGGNPPSVAMATVTPRWPHSVALQRVFDRVVLSVGRITLQV